jgi:PKD repeat protein
VNWTWDFDDGSGSAYGEEVTHQFTNDGAFNVNLTVKDDDDATDFIVHTITVGNQSPGVPNIDGPPSGKPDKEYEYTFNATDPNGDDVKYYISWGDNTTYETEFNASGTDVMIKHTWSEDGTYTITAKAQDIHGLNSSEGTLTVKIPRNRAIQKSPFINFLQNHPNLFPILRILLRLQ